MSTTEAVSYLRWKKDVDEHDYAAASSYLSLRFGESMAEKTAAALRKLPVITRRANDILRATGRVPLPLSDPGVLKDLKKVLSGEKLSPVLLAEADIADGYHRVSLAYALDPYAEVPLKLGAIAAKLRRRREGTGRDPPAQGYPGPGTRRLRERRVSRFPRRPPRRSAA
ncbi:MAG TPA: hypothetical protein VG142_10070 [Trebonia sp.]|jgi:hypothetical protein|nr:hypothetical protein [Trebonia sp.]